MNSTMPLSCSHVESLAPVAPRTEGCEGCLKLGAKWVHLRMCLTCGHVGCCDESEHHHARAHFEEMGHPAIRSAESGEDWAWCYLDRTLLRPKEGGGYQVVATEHALRAIPLFAELEQEDLDRIYALAVPEQVHADHVLMREGDPGDAMYVILDGEFEVTKRSGGGEVVLGRRKTGEVIGEISLVADEPRVASVTAVRDSRVLVISLYAFQQLLACSPSAVRAVLRTMAMRLRSTEVVLAQQDKMAALGRLTAGLAHELNNPAAAVERSSAQMAETYNELQRLNTQVEALGLDAEQLSQLAALRDEVSRRANEPSQAAFVDPLARSDMEADLQEWLESRGVEDAWDLAPTLVGLGWDGASLEEWTGSFDEEHMAALVPWLARAAQVYTLLGEVKMGAERISSIVKAVKSYSYLDQAPVQHVDIHEGLENTLVILKHKLKGGIEVRREYDRTLPRVEAYAGELNQVWTNLLDNAADALEGKGTITIRTYRDGPERVAVEIEDNGTGIPPEVQPRIFQPFFTTKDVGAGTGLGLHVAYNVVVDKHHGQIGVSSQPGKTCFKVTLPLRLDQ